MSFHLTSKSIVQVHRLTRLSDLAPELWRFSRSFSVSTGRNASMPLTLWSTPTFTVTLFQPSLAIFPSWRRATNTTDASSTIERPRFPLPLRVALLDADLNRAPADRTQGFTMKPTVDAMASTVVDPTVVATHRHLVVQRPVRDCLPGLEALMGSLHARHLQSGNMALVSHITMVLVTGPGTGTEIGNETGTVTGNPLEEGGPFLDQDHMQMSTHTFHHINLTGWIATNRTAGAETGPNLTPGVEHVVDRLRQRGHLTERGSTTWLADRIANHTLLQERYLAHGDTMIAPFTMRDTTG